MRDGVVVDLIRHGEPVGGKRYRGCGVDDPLSEKGWRQMWQAVGEQHPWRRIVTSPLRRCAEFAHALGARWGIAVEQDARLCEMAFGEWEGRTAEDICHGDPLRIERYRLDPVRHRPAGAEPLQDFARRVEDALDALVEKNAGGHVLIVAHAGVIRMLLALSLGMPVERLYRIQVGNAALSRLRFTRVEENWLKVLEFHDGRLPPARQSVSATPAARLRRRAAMKSRSARRLR